MSSKQVGWLALGIILAVISPCFLGVGLLQLMAEGPHGPHGEITGDPGAGPRMALALLGFLLVAGGSATSFYFCLRRQKSRIENRES